MTKKKLIKRSGSRQGRVSAKEVKACMDAATSAKKAAKAVAKAVNTAKVKAEAWGKAEVAWGEAEVAWARAEKEAAARPGRRNRKLRSGRRSERE